jgi:type I restriction enzyme S subunit
MSVIPAGYKQTDVGVIPKDWETPQLEALGAGAVPAIKAGPFGSSLTKDTYVPVGFKVYGQEQVIRGDYLFGDYFISASKYRELESCSVRPGDILLSLVGTAGKLLVLPEDAPAGVINPRLIRFTFDKARVCSLFFKNLFDAGQVQGFLARSAQGGTMGVLNASMLRPMKIPLPPLPEQRAIAAALSDVDALLAKLDQFIAKNRDLKQAAMQQLLTGQTRLPGFSGEWEERTVRSIVETPVTDGPHLTPRFLDDGIPFLSVNNLANNEIDLGGLRYISVEDDKEFSKKCKPRRGDVLLGKAASVGKVAIVDSDMDFNIWSPIALIRVGGGHSPRFVYYQLQSSELTKQIVLLTNASSQGNIGMGDIEKLALRLPPPDEQTAIATVLSDMDAELATLEARRDKTRALKQGMMQELLTGRIRLV